MDRPVIIVGNWKMHKTLSEAARFIEELIPHTEGASCEIRLAVPFTAIYACSSVARGSKVAIGAQNMSDQDEGAFTGEISAKMLKEVGSSFVILGHSERRSLFGETDEHIHRKLRRSILEMLPPILCIGESERDRKGGKSMNTLEKQLDGALKDLKPEELKWVSIAYEPVWAIGTGKTATAEMAQETHAAIRAYLTERVGKEWASGICILYGGSVKPGNIETLLNQPDIDGALIGGASLDINAFSQMVQR